VVSLRCSRVATQLCVCVCVFISLDTQLGDHPIVALIGSQLVGHLIVKKKTKNKIFVFPKDTTRWPFRRNQVATQLFKKKAIFFLGPNQMPIDYY